MFQQIHHILKDTDLTGGEIKVYAALLKLGSVTVGPIVDNSHVSSSKVYIILEKLIDKGLVSYIIKQKTKYFQAAPPHALDAYMEEKEKDIQSKRKKIQESISEIKKLQMQHSFGEEARIFRGYKGMQTAWEEIISSFKKGDEYLFTSVGYGDDPYLQRFFRNVVKKIRKQKIPIKGLAQEKERKLYEKKYLQLGYQVRFTTIPWPSDITIAGEHILIFVWDKKEPVVYTIRSSVLAKAYTEYFYSIWSKAKK